MNDEVNVVKMLMRKKMMPCIIFCANFDEAENTAIALAKYSIQSSLNESKDCTSQRSDLLRKIAEDQLASLLVRLSPAFQQYPQAKLVSSLLTCGIGLWHDSMHPSLRSISEECFCNGLVDLLVATPQFAVGRPSVAQSVVIKLDGLVGRGKKGEIYGKAVRHKKKISMAKREILKDESCDRNCGYFKDDMLPIVYQHLCACAGRPSIDESGTVIVLTRRRLQIAYFKQIVLGLSPCIRFTHHYSFSSLLLLISSLNKTREFWKKKGMSMEKMIDNFYSQTFAMFFNTHKTPYHIKASKQLHYRPNATYSAGDTENADKFSVVVFLIYLRRLLLNYTMRSQSLLPYLNSGRLVKVSKGQDDLGWGIVIGIRQASELDSEQFEDFNQKRMNRKKRARFFGKVTEERNEKERHF
eukprot:MONOS_334.1-p1 / transcript=MONOS_334.1 / gene=MONOS_334 / organism=Monocercomonoides_exilis_PA203 / gene_product=unspecified product / transcript_product=unspecified product / location=Mono_scaffold00005:220065-222130(+) / protein_length=411 / sequence_SO=supercontig / SO=protein_coding / is_pseudo=false